MQSGLSLLPDAQAVAMCQIADLQARDSPPSLPFQQPSAEGEKGEKGERASWFLASQSAAHL